MTSSPVRIISSVYRFSEMPLWDATKPVMRSCICSNQRMVWGTPSIMPEWRTGWTVMVAVGTMKLRWALTASGMPMEWPPPSTTAALGLEMLAMSSAHGVEQDQQALDGGVFLHGHQLGDDMLILGGLLALGRFHMALHLSDDRQAVDGVSSPGAVNAAHILDLLFFQPLLLHGDVLLFL